MFTHRKKNEKKIKMRPFKHKKQKSQQQQKKNGKKRISFSLQIGATGLSVNYTKNIIIGQLKFKYLHLQASVRCALVVDYL